MSSEKRESVKKYYGSIANQVLKTGKGSCCCSSSCCGNTNIASTIYNEENIQDLPKEAVNASLGCAAPILFADIKEGEVVLDLGSGGGIDVLQASKWVGKNGKVYGLDMTEDMLELANRNKEKAGVSNVEFIKGYIEEIPLPSETIDVIISNCVINLCEDKKKALSEAYRVLKAGGRMAIADIVSTKEIPDIIRKNTAMWSGCIGGTIAIQEYQNILKEVGFKNIEITPVHSYTLDYIKNIADAANIDLETIGDPQQLQFLDGAFVSGIIKAVK